MALANRFSNPYPNFFNISGQLLAGGQLNFYVSSSGARANTYSNSAHSSANANPITLDAYGKPPVDIFLDPSITYRVVLTAAPDPITGAAGAPIWTADPYYDPLLQQQAKVQVYNGNPNGFVAGTAGTPGGSPSDIIYDSADNLWYVCTTTGVAAAAVWTSIAVSATQALPLPQGRLTLTTQTPVLAAEVTAAGSVLYTPYVGNLIPIYNGANFVLNTFAELTLTLNATPHVANSLYDVFVFLNSGVVTLCTGPAWSFNGTYYSGSTVNLTSPGAAARGAGPGSTQISRLNGLWVNTVLLNGKNGSTTYSNIPANQATYLGTIWTDATAAQVSCHMTYGQGRKFGVWNAYNRTLIVLTAGDATATWAYNTATLRKANATAANSATVLCGLPEEWVDAVYQVELLITGNGTIVQAQNGIGYSVTNAASGVSGWLGENASTTAVGGVLTARYAAPPALGLAAIVALEAGSSVATNTWQGTSASMELRATWRG